MLAPTATPTTRVEIHPEGARCTRTTDLATSTVENDKEMIAVKTPKFQMGQVVATQGAIAALEDAGQAAWFFLSQHAAGEWGVVDDEDKNANNEALKDGSRLLSAYLLRTGEKIWCITDAEDDHGRRVATTLLLPHEY